MKCTMCNGSGMVVTGAFGPKPCPTCGGSGSIYEKTPSEPKYKSPSYGVSDFMRNRQTGSGCAIAIFVIIAIVALIRYLFG